MLKKYTNQVSLLSPSAAFAPYIVVINLLLIFVNVPIWFGNCERPLIETPLGLVSRSHRTHLVTLL
jgi:hypothetical protein